MRFVYIIISVLLFISCIDKEMKHLHTLTIIYELPEKEKDEDISGTKVQITNVYSGRKYTTIIENNKAQIDLETGIYNIFTSIFSQEGGNLAGSLNEVELADEAEKTVILKIKNIYTSPLIIKEIYYSGANTPLNKPYFSDQYVVIYNNSDKPQSLKDLCISTIVGNSNTPSKWRDEKGELLPYLPINITAWRFPDNSKKLELQAGESIVIAQDAINHSDPAVSTSKVDLSNADFETFQYKSGKDYDELSVENMDLIWTKSDKIPDWILSPNGPPVVLFRLPNNYETFVNNPDNMKFQPNSVLQYLCIPKTYVLDAVECVKDEQSTNKSLHNELDAGYIFVPRNNAGYIVKRKIQDNIGAYTVYMDTNNSSNDFVYSQEPSVMKIVSNNNSFAK